MKIIIFILSVCLLMAIFYQRNVLQDKVSDLAHNVEILGNIVKELNTVSVVVTSYNATAEQTDSTPEQTACMVYPSVGSIAVSRDLFWKGFTCGKKVYIKGLGIFTIKDVMHPRWTNRLDVVTATQKDAYSFGKKNLDVILLNNYNNL